MSLDTATITFSDGETVEIKETDLIWGTRGVKNDHKVAGMNDKQLDTYRFNFPETTGINGPFDLYSHSEYGLVPSLTEIFNSYGFFYLDSDPHTVYASSSIVKITID